MQRSWEEACKYLVSVAKRGGLCVASGLCVANPVRSAAVCACTVVVGGVIQGVWFLMVCSLICRSLDASMSVSMLSAESTVTLPRCRSPWFHPA